MLLSFILALFSKVTAATLPLVILALDFTLGKENVKKPIFLYFLLFLLSGIFIWIGVNASGSFGHITELSENYSLADRAFLILDALGLYIVKAIVPFNQSVIYLYPWKASGWLPPDYYFNGICTMLFLVVTMIIGWRYRKNIRGQAWLLGLIFFLLTISIVLPLKWSRTILIAERYTYIPYIGLFGGLLMIGYQYYSKASPWLRKIMTGILSLVLIYYCYTTYERNEVWKTPLTLFKDVVVKNRSDADVSMGYYNCGNEYLRLGKPEDAISDYSSAISFNPIYAEAYYNRGLTYYLIHSFPEAITDFSTSIKINAGNPDAFINRGIAYRSVGENNLALADFNHVVSSQQSGLAYYNRGALYYFNLGDSLQACSDWKKALEHGYAPAYDLLSRFCK